jgi:hypothetical protein
MSVPTPIAEHDFEVTLTVEGKAENAGKMIFSFAGYRLPGDQYRDQRLPQPAERGTVTQEWLTMGNGGLTVRTIVSLKARSLPVPFSEATNASSRFAASLGARHGSVMWRQGRIVIGRRLPKSRRHRRDIGHRAGLSPSLP